MKSLTYRFAWIASSASLILATASCVSGDLVLIKIGDRERMPPQGARTGKPMEKPLPNGQPFEPIAAAATTQPITQPAGTQPAAAAKTTNWINVTLAALLGGLEAIADEQQSD